MIYTFLFTNYYLLDKKQLKLVETLASCTTFPLYKVNNEGKTLSHDKRELEKTMQKCLQMMRQGIQ